MAFQLLTFFILTYHPMPSEGQFVMNLLPAAPATDIGARRPPTTRRPTPTTCPPRSGPCRRSSAPATAGSLGRIVVGETEFPRTGGARGRSWSSTSRTRPAVRPDPDQGRSRPELLRADAGDRRLLQRVREGQEGPEAQLRRAAPGRGRVTAWNRARAGGSSGARSCPGCSCSWRSWSSGWGLVWQFVHAAARSRPRPSPRPTARPEPGRARPRPRVRDGHRQDADRRSATSPPMRYLLEKARGETPGRPGPAEPPRRLLHPPLGAARASTGACPSTCSARPCASSATSRS